MYNIFKEKYKSLYNEQQAGTLSQTLLETKAEIAKSCKDCKHGNNSHLHYITPAMVQRAVRLLNRGKKDDSFNVYTDGFIEAPKKLSVYIAFLLTIMLRHGLSNDVFDLITFSPLVKSKRKSLSNSDNYRAIALNSSLCKILDYILLDYFKDILQSSNYQFAYKKDFSTSLCTFTVMETIQYYRSRGSRVIASLLDCSKAFDRVRYSKLFQILTDRGLCPLVIRLLIIMYFNIRAHVKWNSVYSDKFSINNGVKQGGVMSPVLFTLYIDKLISNVIQAGVGCHIGGICSAIFVYADDIILLAPTRRAMQALLDKCEQFGAEYGITYNPDKCESIVFGEQVNIQLTLCNKILKMVDKVKHLGHCLSNSREIFSLAPMISDIKTRTNVILSQFRFLNVDSRKKLFNTNCTSYYGSNLANLQMPDMKALDCTWRVCSRRILGVNERTHCNMIPSLMSTLTPSSSFFSRMHSFFLNGFYHTSDVIAFYFRNCFANGESIMFRNLSYISSILNVSLQELLLMPKINVKRRLGILCDSQEKWKSLIIWEVINCMENFSSCGLDYLQLKDILDFLCTS